METRRRELGRREVEVFISRGGLIGHGIGSNKVTRTI